MGKVYYDQDGHIEAIQDKVIAIIGYGNQGRSQALNMRDSGAKHIIVGSIHDESWNTANADGFQTYSIAEAAKKADILFLLLPDEVAPEIYEKPMVMMEKMADMGLFKQLPLHSRTSQYGQLSRFKMVDNSSMRKFIEEQYNNIVNGTFAKEWEEVKADGMKKFDELWAETEQLPISQVEAEVRKNLSGGKHVE